MPKDIDAKNVDFEKPRVKKLSHCIKIIGKKLDN